MKDNIGKDAWADYLRSGPDLGDAAWWTAADSYLPPDLLGHERHADARIRRVAAEPARHDWHLVAYVKFISNRREGDSSSRP